MKNTERKHLKENELAHTLVAAQSFLEGRGRGLALAIGGLVIVGLAVLGVNAMRGRGSAQADQLLSEAMVALNARVVPVGAQGEDDVPAAASIGATGTFRTEAEKLTAAVPKLKAAADAFPDAEAGIQARYHMAGALASLGRHADAMAAFDEVTAKAGRDSLVGRMARLGKADAQAKSGQVDAAITTWKELATQSSADLPVDAILMELARAYVQQGKTEEARKTFTEIVEQHPTSPYTADARQELENLKG
jgi:tetratricopeptide (TPR) repeat protein